MTKYREIIRLTGMGFSQRDIMASCGVAQKTVVKVQKRAKELNLSWPLDETLTDIELQKLMFSNEYSDAIVHLFRKFRAPFSGKAVHTFPERGAVI